MAGVALLQNVGMVEKDWVFVLGAQDPEMREIERVLRRAGQPFVHAAKGGVRCVPKTAYEADGVVRMSRTGRPLPTVLLPDAPIVCVECSLADRPPVLRVDHHYPGDPGYEKGPESYLQGSSIGQVLHHFEMEPNETQRLLAAADHCLTAAYQGACPGVDPHELLFLRASWQAKVSGRSIDELLGGILASAEQVERHYDAALGEAVFLDPTEVPAELAEGAALAGKPVRYRQWFPDGQLKEMLKGGSPAHIERFMQEHQMAGREVYGNPHRGYAGTYYD